jgi:hypothetical protein
MGDHGTELELAHQAMYEYRGWGTYKPRLRDDGTPLPEVEDHDYQTNRLSVEPEGCPLPRCRAGVHPSGRRIDDVDFRRAHATGARDGPP